MFPSSLKGSKLFPILLLSAVTNLAAATASTEPPFLVAWPVPHAVMRSWLLLSLALLTSPRQVLFDSTASALFTSNPTFLHSFSSRDSPHNILAVLQTGDEGQAFASFTHSDFVTSHPIGQLRFHLPELSLYSQHTLLVLTPATITCQCYRQLALA
jgi:hypothetical protein